MASPASGTPNAASPMNKRQEHDLILLGDPLGVGGRKEVLPDNESGRHGSFANERGGAHRPQSLAAHVGRSSEIMIDAGLEALREFQGRTCFYFRHNHPVRLFCARLVRHVAFETLVLTVIVLAVVVMCMQTPKPMRSSPQSSYDDTLDYIDHSTTLFFTGEFFIKIVADGLYGRVSERAYLKDAWNRLDLLVIITGLPLAFGFFFNVDTDSIMPGKFAAVRALRVLRPLKAIKFFSGIQDIMDALVASIPLLYNVMLFLSLSMIMFVLFGTEFFYNSLNRYVLLLLPFTVCPQLTAGNRRCKVISNNFTSHPPLYCSGTEHKGRPCPSQQYCDVNHGNPNQNFTSFDSFDRGLLVVIQCMSLSDWYNYMYAIQSSEYFGSWFFFLMIILVFSFLLINLSIAVISATFNQIRSNPDHHPNHQFLKGGILFNAHQDDDLIDVGHMDADDAIAFTRQRKLRREYESRLASGAMLAPHLLSNKALLLGEQKKQELAQRRRSTAHFNRSTSTGPSALSTLELTEGGEDGDGGPFTGSSTTKKKGIMDLRQVSKKVLLGTKIALLQREQKERREWDLLHEGSCLCVSWNRLCDPFERFIKWKWFDRVVIIMILLNTLAMAIVHYDQSHEQTVFLEVMEYWFTLFFLVELIVKVFGLRGLRAYIRSNSNKFDFIVVITSMDSLFNIQGSAGGQKGANISALRVFRLARILRVTRVLRRDPRIRKLLDAALGSVVPLVNLLVFLTFVLIVFAILGMQFFGGLFVEMVDTEGNYVGHPRQNFDTFLDAIISLFQILTGDTWYATMYYAMDCKDPATGKPDNAAYFAAPFFIIFFCFSNYVLLNLFVAIILENFDKVDEEKLRLQRLDLNKTRKETIRLQLMKFKRLKVDDKSGPSTARVDEHTVIALPILPPGMIINLPKFIDAHICSSWPTEDDDSPPKSKCAFRDRSCSCCDKHNCFRRICEKIEGKRDEQGPFEYFILVCIVVSSFLLAFDNPRARRENPQLRQTLLTCDIVFFVIFLLEFIIRITTRGFLFTKASYMSDRWNWLDFFVMFVSLISIVTNSIPGIQGGDTSFLRVLRLGRTLRPLRMVNKNPGMKKVIDSLIDSLPAVAQVFALGAAFFLVFGILGINLFMGKFNLCNDDSVENKGECVGVWVDVVCSGGDCSYFSSARVWTTPMHYTFDSIAWAYMVLFEVATMDSWSAVMYSAMDIRISPDTGTGNLAELQPRENANPAAALYFLVFICVGGLFVLQLFIGVIVDSFNNNSGINYTMAQSQWMDIKKLCRHQRPFKPPPRPGHRTRAEMRGLTEEEEEQQADEQAEAEMKRFDGRTQVARESLIDAVQAEVENDADAQHEAGAQPPPATRLQPAASGTQTKEEEEEHRSCCNRYWLAARNRCYDLVVVRPYADWFEDVTIGLICLNIVFMCTKHVGQPQYWSDTLYYAGMTFIFIFTVELILKVMALGPRRYFKDNWNKFDALVILGSYIALIPTDGADANNPMSKLYLVGKFARIFRILRIFRLFKKHQGLFVLLRTMVKSIPDIANVLVLMMLLMFVYAVIMVEMFGQVKHGHFVNHNTNFETFTFAMTSLLRMMTLSWVGLMNDCWYFEDSCTFATVDRYGTPTRDNEDDCGLTVAPLIFFSYVVLTTYVMWNVLLAVVIDKFSDVYSLASCTVNEIEIRNYVDCWQELDPLGSGYLQMEQVPRLLISLGLPMGLGERSHVLRLVNIRENIKSQNISVAGKGVPFRSLLLMLCVNQLGPGALTIKEEPKYQRMWAQAAVQTEVELAALIIQKYVMANSKWALKINRQRDLDMIDKFCKGDIRPHGCNNKLTGVTLKLNRVDNEQFNDVHQGHAEHKRRIAEERAEERLKNEENSDDDHHSSSDEEDPH